MPKFFMYNNGRSIWNIDHIQGMIVTDTIPPYNKERYYVIVLGYWHEADKEEYQKLVEFIKENDRT